MGKSQFPSIFNWQTTSPVIGFLPAPGPGQDIAGNSKPLSGVIAGAMTGTSTIYTNILGLRQTDNQGIELTWTGTPTGTISVMVSNSGINFYALTFSPPLSQPGGSAGGYVISLTAIPFQYMFLQYVNASGTGTITTYSQCKANNR
jgi:Flp pilus assembly protein TadG